MNTRTQQVILHIAGWMVFLALPLLFSPESLSLKAYLTNQPTQRELVSYILVLAVFYLNFYWLIPKLYFSKRYFTFVVAGILCFLPIVLLPAYLLPFHRDPPHQPPAAFFPGNRPGQDPPSPARETDNYPSRPSAPTSLRPPPVSMTEDVGYHPRSRFLFMDIGQHLFLFLGMILLALMLKIRERWKQTEREVLQTELSYLKAQINPHFLFNSLNGIYALALEKSDQAPEAIVKLSDMMRYVLNETGKEWVSLQKEIEYIRNYIALQQTRFGDSIPLDFQVIIQPESAPVGLLSPTGDPKIAPLILIPFIENSFKHGVNAEENSEIHIRIEVSGNQLHLLVINNKVTVHSSAGTHSGLGIDNTKRRLQLLYPGNHLLEIQDRSHDFQVSLTLELNG